MKVLVVHEVSYLSKIIYEYQILPEMLSMLGHDVTVIDYDDTWASEPGQKTFSLSTRVFANVHRAYPQASVTVRRPGMIRLPLIARVSGAVTAGLEIWRWLAGNPVDAILLYGVPTVGAQTILAARHFKVPVMFRSIDVTSRLVPSALLVPPTRALEAFVYRRANAITSVTLHLKKYVESYGVPESRVRVLPSGVDAKIFSPALRNDALMSSWGIAPDDPVILFMGTIYKFSGLDRVIQDFPALLARHPKAKLLIVGNGEDENRLKRLAATVGVSGNVVFGGLQPYDRLPDIIRSSDICINPFELNEITRDILPTKLFQYLACGKPVVATELPGTIPFLAGEEQGMVYTTLDKFVSKLEELLDRPDYRNELGLRGTAISEDKYDWKQISQTMAEWMILMAMPVGS